MLFYLYLRHIRRYAHDVPWIHLGIALVGNFCFVVGSLFFLSPALTRAGTWLFVVASWGLLVGVCGEILARYEGLQRQKATAASPGHVPSGHAAPGRQPVPHGPTDTPPGPQIARDA